MVHMQHWQPTLLVENFILSNTLSPIAPKVKGNIEISDLPAISIGHDGLKAVVRAPECAMGRGA